MEHENRAEFHASKVVTIRHITHVNDAGTHVHAGMALVQVPSASGDCATLMCPCNTTIYTQLTIPYAVYSQEHNAGDGSGLLTLEVFDATAGSTLKSTSSQSDAGRGVHFVVDLFNERSQQHLFAVRKQRPSGEGEVAAQQEFQVGVTEMLVNVEPAAEVSNDSQKPSTEANPWQRNEDQFSDALLRPERRGTCILVNFTPTSPGFLASVLRGMHKSVARGRLVLLFPDGGSDCLEGDPFAIGNDVFQSRTEIFMVDGELSLSSHRVSIELQIAAHAGEHELGIESKWVPIAVTVAQLIPPYSLTSASTASHMMACVGTAATEAVAHCTLHAAAVPRSPTQKTWAALRSQCVSSTSQISRARLSSVVKPSGSERSHTARTQCIALLCVRGFVLWDARDDATGVMVPSQLYPRVTVTVSGGHQGLIASTSRQSAQLPAARTHLIAQSTFTASHPTAAISICGTSQNNLFGYATFTPFDQYVGAEESNSANGSGWLPVHGIAGECGAVLIDYVLAFSRTETDEDGNRNTSVPNSPGFHAPFTPSALLGQLARKSQIQREVEVAPIRWGTIALEIVRARGLRFDGLGSACSAYATLTPLPLTPAPTRTGASEESSTHCTGTVECSNDPRWDAMFMMRNTPTTSEGLVVRVVDTDAVDANNIVGSAFLLWDEPLWKKDTGEVWVPLVTDTYQSWQCVGVLLVRWTVLGRCYPSSRGASDMDYQQRYGQATALSVPVTFAQVHLSWPLLSFCGHASFAGALGLALDATKGAFDGRSQCRLLLRASCDGGQHKCTLALTSFQSSAGVASFELPRRFMRQEHQESREISQEEEFLACLVALSPASGNPCRQLTVWLEVEFADPQRTGTYSSRVIGSGSGKIHSLGLATEDEEDADAPRWCSEVELRMSSECSEAIPFSDPALVRVFLSPAPQAKRGQQLAVRNEQDELANLQYVQMGNRIAEGTHTRHTAAPRTPEPPAPPVLSCVEEQAPVPVAPRERIQSVAQHQHENSFKSRVDRVGLVTSLSDASKTEPTQSTTFPEQRGETSAALDMCCDASVPPATISDGGLEVEILEARNALSAAGASENDLPKESATDARYGVVLGCGVAFRCATTLKAGANPVFREAYVVPVHLLAQPRGELRVQLICAHRTAHHADEVVGSAVLSCDELEQCADDSLPVWVTMRGAAPPSTTSGQREVAAQVLLQVRWRGTGKATLEQYRKVQSLRQKALASGSSWRDDTSAPVAALGELGKQLYYWEIFVGDVEGGLDEWVRALLPAARSNLFATAFVACETASTISESSASAPGARNSFATDLAVSAMTTVSLVRKPQSEKSISSAMWAERFLMPFGHGESVFHFRVRVSCKDESERDTAEGDKTGCASHIWLDAATHFAQDGARAVGYWVEDNQTWSLLTLRMRVMTEGEDQEQHQKQLSSASDLWGSPRLRVALRRRVFPLHNFQQRLSSLPIQLKPDRRQQQLLSRLRPFGLSTYPANSPLAAVLSVESVHLSTPVETGSVPSRYGSGISVEVLLTTHVTPDTHSVSCARFVGPPADPTADRRCPRSAFEPRSQTIEAMNNSVGLLEVIDSQTRACLGRGIITFAKAQKARISRTVVPLFSRHAPLQDGLRGGSIGAVNVQLIYSNDSGTVVPAAPATNTDPATMRTPSSESMDAVGVTLHRILTVRCVTLSGVVDAVDPRKANETFALSGQDEQESSPPPILRLEAQANGTESDDAADECRRFQAAPQSFYAPLRCSQCLSSHSTFPSPLSTSHIDLRKAPPFFQFIAATDAMSAGDNASQKVLLFDIRLLGQTDEDESNERMRLAVGCLTVPPPAPFPTSPDGNVSFNKCIPLHAIGAKDDNADTRPGSAGALPGRDAIHLQVRAEWQYRASCGLRMTCVRVRTARRSNLINPFIVFVLRHNNSDRVSAFPLALFPEKTGTLHSSTQRRRHLSRTAQLPLWSLRSVLLPLVTLPLLHAACDVSLKQVVLEQIQLRDRLSANVDTLVGVCSVPSAADFAWNRWMFNRQPQWVSFYNGEDMHAPHEVLLQTCVETGSEPPAHPSQPPTLQLPSLLIGSSMQHRTTFTVHVLMVHLDGTANEVSEVQVNASLRQVTLSAEPDKQGSDCWVSSAAYKVERDEENADAEWEARWEVSESPAVSYTFTPTLEESDSPIPPPVEIHVRSAGSSEVLGTAVFAWNDFCYAHSGVATVGIQKRCGCRVGTVRVNWDIALAAGQRDNNIIAMGAAEVMSHSSSKGTPQNGQSKADTILNDLPHLPQCIHTIRSAPPSPPALPSVAATVICRANVTAARGLKLARCLPPKDDCCASSAVAQGLSAHNGITGDVLATTVVRAVIQLRSKKKGRMNSTLTMNATCDSLATAVRFKRVSHGGNTTSGRPKEHTPLNLTLADLAHPGSTLSLWQVVSAKEAYFLGRVSLNMSIVRNALHGANTKTVHEAVSVWLPLHTRSGKHLTGTSVRLHLLPPPAPVVHPRPILSADAAHPLTTKWALCFRVKRIEMVTTELPFGAASSQLSHAAVQCVLSWWTLAGADRHSTTSLHVSTSTTGDGDASTSPRSHRFELVPTTALLAMGPLTLTECKPKRFFDISIVRSTSVDSSDANTAAAKEWRPATDDSTDNAILATTRVSFADLQGPRHQSPIAQLMDTVETERDQSILKDFSSPLEVLLRNSDSSVWATMQCEFMWCHSGELLNSEEEEDKAPTHVEPEAMRKESPASYLSATSRSCTVLPIKNANPVVGPQGCAGVIGDMRTSLLFGGLRNEENKRVSVCTWSWESCDDHPETVSIEMTPMDDGDTRDGPRESVIGHTAVAVSDGAFIVDGGIVASTTTTTAEDAAAGIEFLLGGQRAGPDDSGKAARMKMLSETWKFTPRTASHGFWEKIAATEGSGIRRSPRAFHTAVFCSVLNTVVYFGGWAIHGDTVDIRSPAASVTSEVHCLHLDLNRSVPRMSTKLTTLGNGSVSTAGRVPPLAAHTAVLCGERLMVVFGGLTCALEGDNSSNDGSAACLTATSGVHILDLETFRWSTHDGVAQQRTGTEANIQDEKNTLSWPSPRFGHSATWLPGRHNKDTNTSIDGTEQDADFGTMLVFGGDRLFDTDELLWSYNIRDRRWQRIEIHHSVPLLPRFLSSLVVFRHKRHEVTKRGKVQHISSHKHRHHKREVVTVEEEVTFLLCGGCLPRHSDRSSTGRRHRVSVPPSASSATTGMLHGLNDFFANIRDPQPPITVVLRETGVIKLL